MDDINLFWWVIVVFPVLFLVGVSFVLFRNFLEFQPLPSTNHTDQAAENSSVSPRFSVCIPARNEEHNIANCLEALARQKHTSYEVIVLDDQSEDRTGEIAGEYAEKFDHFKLLNGQERPEEWLGKPWACRQLAEHSSGDILVFIDADCKPYPDFLNRIDEGFCSDDLDALTVWPEQILKSFWERVTIPVIYYGLLSFLPATYVYRKPRWLPGFIYSRMRHKFAAACGQCIAFHHSAYHGIGTHEAVKGEVVEDLTLARLLRAKNYKLKMYSGDGIISCRMYTSGREVLEGFRKNFFAGFGYKIIPFTLAGLIHFWVYVLPFLMLPIALVIAPPLAIFLIPSIFLIFLHRAMMNLIFNWPLRDFWMQPLSVIWFLRVAVITIQDYYLKRSVSWKNRKI